jgi:hypothetical protein
MNVKIDYHGRSPFAVSAMVTLPPPRAADSPAAPGHRSAADISSLSSTLWNRETSTVEAMTYWILP